jgi:hypothetical protein
MLARSVRGCPARAAIATVDMLPRCRGGRPACGCVRLKSPEAAHVKERNQGRARYSLYLGPMPSLIFRFVLIEYHGGRLSKHDN